MKRPKYRGCKNHVLTPQVLSLPLGGEARCHYGELFSYDLTSHLTSAHLGTQVRTRGLHKTLIRSSELAATNCTKIYWLSIPLVFITPNIVFFIVSIRWGDKVCSLEALFIPRASIGYAAAYRHGT